jgi:hypothetical protein
MKHKLLEMTDKELEAYQDRLFKQQAKLKVGSNRWCKLDRRIRRAEKAKSQV